MLFKWLLCCLICTKMPVILAYYLLMRVYGVLPDTVGMNELLVCWND